MVTKTLDGLTIIFNTRDWSIMRFDTKPTVMICDMASGELLTIAQYHEMYMPWYTNEHTIQFVQSEIDAICDVVPHDIADRMRGQYPSTGIELPLTVWIAIVDCIDAHDGDVMPPDLRGAWIQIGDNPSPNMQHNMGGMMK